MAQTQRSTGWTVNTNPAGLAPSVNPQPADVEQIDFPARIEQELTSLNQAVTEFEQYGGKTEQARDSARSCLFGVGLKGLDCLRQRLLER